MNVVSNSEVTLPELRSFGFIMAALVTMVFGLALPWLFATEWPWWPWVAGLALVVSSATAPGTLRPVYRGWMRFGLMMNRITTPLVMGLVFLLVVVPAGVIMRLVRSDVLRRHFEPEIDTYREVSASPAEDHFARPF